MGWTRRMMMAAATAILPGKTTPETEETPSGYGEGGYGMGGYGGSDPQCFIATAAFDDTHPTVVQLRTFRDEWLLTNRPGRVATRLYYWLSPPVARWISRSDRRRRIVQAIAVKPAARLTKLLTTHD